MSNSTHKVEIVPVQFRRHPNADTLSTTEIFGGYTYVGRTADWVGVTKAAYIPPDNIVDTRRPEFAFLAPEAKADGGYRVRAKKLRGIISFGLMVPVPDETLVGDDWTEKLGVTHYNPPLPCEQGSGGGLHMGGEIASPPNAYSPQYDLDTVRRYVDVFTPGELVVVTEKLDGTNSRYVYVDGQMYCGSHYEWKKEYPTYDHVTVDSILENAEKVKRTMDRTEAEEILQRLHEKPKKRNLWWEMLDRTPSLLKFCEANPGVVVYGETYGSIAWLKYGLPEGNRFAAFDLMKNGKFLDIELAYGMALDGGLPWVPMFHELFSIGHILSKKVSIRATPFDFAKLCEMSEGLTTVEGAKPGTIREGIVISPLEERYDSRVGRVKMKLVSGTYLERKKR